MSPFSLNNVTSLRTLSIDMSPFSLSSVTSLRALRMATPPYTRYITKALFFLLHTQM